MSQITNPDGNKYDEQRFDDTSRTVAPGAVDPNTRLETEPEQKKEHGILRQILNPGGNKRDEVAYGDNARVAHQKSPEELRAGKSSAAGVAGTTAAGTTVSRVVGDDDAKSAMSIKSGVEGPYAGQADEGNVGSSPSTTQNLPDRTAPT
jgi:hypothetical protein